MTCLSPHRGCTMLCDPAVRNSNGTTKPGATTMNKKRKSSMCCRNSAGADQAAVGAISSASTMARTPQKRSERMHARGEPTCETQDIAPKRHSGEGYLVSLRAKAGAGPVKWMALATLKLPHTLRDLFLTPGPLPNFPGPALSLPKGVAVPFLFQLCHFVLSECLAKF
jgi:hypothetical protein